jgi:hypothetical protein
MKCVLLTVDEIKSLLVEAGEIAIAGYIKKYPPISLRPVTDKLLTRLEVSKRTGKDPATISNWIKKGRLKSQKIERNVFIKESDLNAALAAGGNSD